MPTTYQTFVQSLSPLAYYPMNERSGSIALDVSGNAYNGQYNNVLLNSAIGPDNDASVGFDGVASIFTLPAALLAAFNANNFNTFTCSIWFQIPSVSIWNDNVNRRVLSIWDTTPTQQIGIRKRGDVAAFDGFVTMNNNTEYYGFSSFTQPTNWTHMVLVFANGVVTLYLNGVLFQTFNVGKTFPVPMTSMVIGAQAGPTVVFKGNIAHAAFWASTLSTDDIFKLANPLTSTVTPVLSALSNTGTQYQVAIIDPVTGLTQAIFDPTSFYELRYSRKLNDIGVVAFTVPSTDQTRALFSLDTMIEVYRTDPSNATRQMQIEETYLTRLTHRFREGDEEKFLVGGFSLNHLLKRRLIDPAEDSSSAITGYSSKSGPADVVIQAYCYQQMGAGASLVRQVPNLSFGQISGVGLTVSGNFRYTELFQETYDLAIAGRVDFIIQRSNLNQLVMYIQPIGSDKSMKNNYPIRPWVGLSPIRGNLSNPSFMIDRQEERTFIYALGQGQGDQRALFTMAAAGYSDSVYNRWELFLDARTNDKSDTTGLISNAVAELFKYQPKKSFSYRLQGGEGGNVYRVDWDLGDLVTAFWDETLVDLRVWGVEVAVSEQGEEISIDTRLPMLNV